MHQPLRSGDQAGRRRAQVMVLRVQPEAGLFRAAAHQRVEAAEEADEEQRVASFGRGRVEPALAGEGARNAGLAAAEDLGQVGLAQAQRAGRAHQRLAEDQRLRMGLRGLHGGAPFK